MNFYTGNRWFPPQQGYFGINTKIINYQKIKNQEQSAYISVAISAACFTYSGSFRGEIV